MNKDLKEIQEFIRKKVIMAAHPECKTYEKALKKELYNDCLISNNTYEGQELFYKIVAQRLGNKMYLVKAEGCCLIFEKSLDKINEYYKIIGQPLTLDKILRVVIQGERSLATSVADLKAIVDIIYNWDYKLETHKQQSEEIQLAIAKLFGYKLAKND